MAHSIPIRGIQYGHKAKAQSEKCLQLFLKGKNLVDICLAESHAFYISILHRYSHPFS